MTIYTIGHSNVSAERIIELLKEHEIQVLVDVRSAPYSRYSPQFNRESFKAELKTKAGIDYEHAGGTLGGRPEDPTCYKEDGKPDYEAIQKKPWYSDGITYLLQVAEKQKTAIMCSEEDPDRCHRHKLITQTLLEKKIEVVHIRGSGQLEKALKAEAPKGKTKQLPLRL